MMVLRANSRFFPLYNRSFVRDGRGDSKSNIGMVLLHSYSWDFAIKGSKKGKILTKLSMEVGVKWLYHYLTFVFLRKSWQL